MSTRNLQSQTPTSIERPTATTTGTRPAVECAPATFSHRNTHRLENLVDEFNAAFASPRPDRTATDAQ